MPFFRVYCFVCAVLGAAYCWDRTVDTTFASANETLVRGEYAVAVEQYNTLLQNGHAPEIYLNLAKAYEKLGERGHTILAYERACFYFKNTEAVNALQKLNIHVSWLELWPQTFAYHTWRQIAAWSFWLALTALLTTLSLRLRGGATLTSLLVALFIISGYATWANGQNRLRAVLVGSPLTLKISPTTTSPSVRVLSDGTLCRATTQQNEHTWVVTSNGETGWVETARVQLILAR